MLNNYFIMEELFKNSLLGQLTELGLNPSVQDEPNPLAIKINGDIKDQVGQEKILFL